MHRLCFSVATSPLLLLLLLLLSSLAQPNPMDSPYNPLSTWRLPIRSDATLDPYSNDISSQLGARCTKRKGGWNWDREVPPLFRASPNDPFYEVSLPTGKIQFRFPPEAAGGGGSDDPMIVMDGVSTQWSGGVATPVELRIWKVSVNHDKRTASGSGGGLFMINNDGVVTNPQGTPSDSNPFWGAGVGSGLSYIGIVRASEIESDEPIPHALRWIYSSCAYRAENYRWPTIKTDQPKLCGSCDAPCEEYLDKKNLPITSGIEMGMRLRLKRSVDCTARTVPSMDPMWDAARRRLLIKVCEALQNYGMLPTDGSGGSGGNLQFEGNLTANWPRLIGPPDDQTNFNYFFRDISSSMSSKDGGDGIPRLPTDGLPWDQFEVIVDPRNSDRIWNADPSTPRGVVTKALPVADTYTKGDQYATTNFNDECRVAIKNQKVLKYLRVSYVKYALSGIDVDRLETAAVHLSPMSVTEFEGSLEMRKVLTSDWEEDTLTFDTRPFASGELIWRWTPQEGTTEIANVLPQLRAHLKAGETHFSLLIYSTGSVYGEVRYSCRTGDEATIPTLVWSVLPDGVTAVPDTPAPTANGGTEAPATAVPVKDTDTPDVKDTPVPVQATLMPMAAMETTVPAEETPSPTVDRETQVPEDTPMPVKDTPVPVEDTTVPAEDTPVPTARDTAMPAGDTAMPGKDTPMPTAARETTAPAAVQDTPVPTTAGDTTSPVQDTPIPTTARETTAPAAVQDTPVPTTAKDTTAPTNTPLPVEDTPTPAKATPAPTTAKSTTAPTPGPTIAGDTTTPATSQDTLPPTQGNGTVGGASDPENDDDDSGFPYWVLAVVAGGLALCGGVVFAVFRNRSGSRLHMEQLLDDLDYEVEQQPQPNRTDTYSL